jgi:hypothetical protein
MPKSVRTQIIESVVDSLGKIQAGRLVPNLSTGVPHKFLSTVRSVNRRVAGLNDDQKPALYVVDPIETGRHLLADILNQTMQLTVAGLITAPQQRNNTPLTHIVTLLDNLIDDTRAVLVSDPRWNGLSRKCRIVRLEADTSIDAENVAFGVVYEIDYIELIDTGEATAVILPDSLKVDRSGYVNPVPGGMPYGEAVLNALFNAYRTIPGLTWVERPRIWPLPLEQVSARYTPGVWFHETGETFTYGGSYETQKQVSVSTVLLAVETDESQFWSTVDSWVAALKNCMGTYADLLGVIAKSDILSIRTEKCEYPVILIEMDTQLMYVQTFKFN